MDIKRFVLHRCTMARTDQKVTSDREHQVRYIVGSFLRYQRPATAQREGLSGAVVATLLKRGVTAVVAASVSVSTAVLDGIPMSMTSCRNVSWWMKQTTSGCSTKVESSSEPEITETAFVAGSKSPRRWRGCAGGSDVRGRCQREGCFWLVVGGRSWRDV